MAACHPWEGWGPVTRGENPPPPRPPPPPMWPVLPFSEPLKPDCFSKSSAPTQMTRMSVEGDAALCPHTVSSARLTAIHDYQPGGRTTWLPERDQEEPVCLPPRIQGDGESLCAYGPPTHKGFGKHTCSVTSVANTLVQPKGPLLSGITFRFIFSRMADDIMK